MTKGDLLNTFITQMTMMWPPDVQEKRARASDVSEMIFTLTVLGRALAYEQKKEMEGQKES